MGFDLSRTNGEGYLAAVRDASLTPQYRGRAAMRLHMFPVLKEEILVLARDDRLPDATSYWVCEAAFSVMLHYGPVSEDDFADFAPGSSRRATERYGAIQSRLPPGWDIERVRAVSGDPHAEVLPLLGAAFRSRDLKDQGWPMKLGAVIRVRGRFLLRDSDTDEWFVAESEEARWFTCKSGPMRDLGRAIEAALM